MQFHYEGKFCRIYTVCRCPVFCECGDRFHTWRLDIDGSYVPYNDSTREIYQTGLAMLLCW